MGISGWQDRSRRDTGRNPHPRTARGAFHRGERSLPGAFHFRIARLSRFSSSDAALCVPALGGHAAAAGTRGHQMGTAEGHGPVSHAGGRLAAHPHAARSVVKAFARDTSGATAIEYALIASVISILIVGGAMQIGTQVRTFFEESIIPNI